MKKNVARILSVILVFMLIVPILSGCGGKTVKQDNASNEISLAPVSETLSPAAEASIKSNENTVGLMAFYPNNNENMYALAGTNCFTVYFENTRVKVGKGTINIYDATTNSIFSSVNAKDDSSYVISSMDEIGTSITGWESGTKIDIYFDDEFELGASYYVLIDEGFFTLGSINSGAVSNSSLITFDAKQYGVDMTGVGLSRVYNVNDAISFTVLVDGTDATMYALKEYDDTFIEASPINGTADTTLSLKFLKEGNPSITIAFYNSGKMVDSITFTFNVGVSSATTEIIDSSAIESSEVITQTTDAATITKSTTGSASTNNGSNSTKSKTTAESSNSASTKNTSESSTKGATTGDDGVTVVIEGE